MKLKEIFDKLVENQKPENVKQRLKDKIDIAKLENELAEIKEKKPKPKIFYIGDIEVKQK